MEILLTFVIDALLSPISAAIDDIDTPPKAVVVLTVLAIAGVYAAMEFHKSVQPVALLMMCLALVSCDSMTDVTKKDGTKIFHRGAVAENTLIDYVRVKRSDGTEIESLKVAKDQQSAVKGWMMWKGLPGVLKSGGEMTKDVADGVGTVIK